MAKILLVDDDESLRSALTKTLQRMGHDIRTAENGRKAMQVHQNWLPTLIITDLIMPEQEGLETIQAVRSKDKAVKIIAMSGGGRSNPNDYLEIARHLGADAILPKPFDVDELLSVLTRVLPSD